MRAFTTVFAMLFLGERMHWFHGVGIVAIVLGIVLCTTTPARPLAAQDAAA